MNSEVGFLELIQMARDHMEGYGLTYTSVTRYVRTWRSVYNFALSKGIAHYSAELAERYMLEKYGMSVANLAQTVNVLQSVILTEGDRMVLTPTYHVFDLFKAHQDAVGLDVHLEDVGQAGEGVPQLSASASLKDGALTIAIANTSATAPAEAEVSISGFDAKTVSGRILTGAMRDCNDFDAPDRARYNRSAA